MLKRPPVRMNRKIPLHEADRSFDIEFWRRVGPNGRLNAMWGLVLDYLVQTKKVSGIGVDLDFGKITACVRRGLAA